MRKRHAVSVGCSLVALAVLVGGCSTTTDRTAVSTSSSSRATADPSYVSLRVHTGSQPCGVLVAAGFVWVSDFTDGTLVRLDPATGKQVGPAVKAGDQPCGMAYGAGSIWLPDYGEPSLVRVDAATGGVLARMPIGSKAYDVAFAGGAAWVTNNASGTLTRIDASGGGPHTVPLPPTVNPTGIVASAGSLWVCTGVNGTVLQVSPTTGRIVRMLRLPGQASWTAADDRTVWVSDSAQGTVTRIDSPAAKVLGTSAVGTVPADGDALDGRAWFGDQSDGSVRWVGRDGTVGPPHATGTRSAFTLAAAAGALWVVDFKGTDVVRLDASSLLSSP